MKCNEILIESTLENGISLWHPVHTHNNLFSNAWLMFMFSHTLRVWLGSRRAVPVPPMELLSVFLSLSYNKKQRNWTWNFETWKSKLVPQGQAVLVKDWIDYLMSGFESVIAVQQAMEVNPIVGYFVVGFQHKIPPLTAINYKRLHWK